MAFARAARRARPLLVVMCMMAMTVGTAGCDTVTGWFGDDGPQDVETELIQTVTFGGCLRAFGRDVFDVDASADGSVVLYISSQSPPNLPEDASWRRDDRALYIRSTDDSGAQRFNYIARSWELDDTAGVIAAYSTPRPGQTGVEGFRLSETMRQVQISDGKERVVIAVSRENSGEDLVGLYHGSIPSDVLSTKLSPGEEGDGKLSAVPLNSQRFSEPIQQWALSPDGNRIAAEVGLDGELRVFNFTTDGGAVNLFTLDEENEIVVSEGLPIAYVSDSNGDPIVDSSGEMQPVGIDRNHRPGVLANGAKLSWAPDSNRLAMARTVGVGSAIIDVLDVSTGDLQRLRRFDATDVVDPDDGRSYRVTWSTPQLSWSAEGDSLYMMMTPIGGPELFYDTQFWELNAKTGESESGLYQEIRRFENWRTEPANLINFGDNERFAFTWEDHLYRGDAAGGAAEMLGSPAQLTSFPEGVRVLYEEPIYTSAQDSVLFRLTDRGTLRVGERTSASESQCPADIVPAEEGDGAR